MRFLEFWFLTFLICVASLQSQARSFQFQFREPRLEVYQVNDDKLAAHTESLEATNAANHRVEFTSRMVLQLKVGEDHKRFIAGTNLKLSRTVAPGVMIFQAPDAATCAREAHRLSALPEVIAAAPVMRRDYALHGSYAYKPTDGFFGIYGQFGEAFHWYLENRNADGSRAGFDLNVRAAWPFTMGQGVTVAVADTGVETNHVELAPRLAGGPHFNFLQTNMVVVPTSRTFFGAHGTEVSGLIAAQKDNARMVGVAPRAQLASWVIFDSNIVVATDEQLMDMYQYQSNVVAVQNHSWGPTGVKQNAPGVLEQVGISNAINFGRNGLGTVMVRSCGNDRGRGTGARSDDNGLASDPRVISVAAVRIDGRVASYSQPGASVLVGAPSGDLDAGWNALFTTDLIGTDGANPVSYFPPNQDLSDYVYYSLGFEGTSASAPLISGVAALILGANTNLTYRDVQQILILSSRHVDLADPDVVTNGAGFKVGHFVGFGVPDAGLAVDMARHWTNRPPLTNVIVTVTNTAAIPDDGLRVLVTGDNIPTNLASVRTLPSTSLHADTPTLNLPLVYVGLATNPIAINLTNKGALIERDTNDFSLKITYAAQAGAAFAVVRNYATNTSGSGAPGGDQLFPIKADFVTIPAVFIGYNDGVGLENLFQTNGTALAQISLNSTSYVFSVTNTLLCEHVGLRVMTDHTSRSQIRITLVSPMGTRSVLQRYNGDTSAGPTNWTYYSTHHFYESSAGNWTAYFSDEYATNTGSVLGVSLIINGVPINDNDHDGLDDGWEMANFGSLAYGPKDDPDKDGFNNMREQIMGTNPNAGPLFRADLSRWDKKLARLSWPTSSNFTYEVRGGTNVGNFSVITNLSGQFPETEYFTSYTNSVPKFFNVRSIPVP